MDETKFQNICNSLALVADTTTDLNKLLLEGCAEGVSLEQLSAISKLGQKCDGNLRITLQIVTSQIPGTIMDTLDRREGG